MSIFPFSDAINAPDLQVWNNAAFDNDESVGSAPIKASWSSFQQVCENGFSVSLQSDCSKENMSPVFVKSPGSVKSSVPVKPLQPNNVNGNSHGKPLKLSAKLALNEPLSELSKENFSEEERKEEVVDNRNIDLEIEEIEKEISRLSTKLKALRMEKAEQTAKTMERRGRIVSAKFMDPKQSLKNSDGDKKPEDPSSNGKLKINRRGLSLGPSEIFAGSGSRRTCISLGPSEIIAGIGPRRPGKLEITPVQSIQSRRKSCFWKLQEIDELKVTKGRGNSLSLSPKTRRTVSKIQGAKQPATTVGSKRPTKKEESIIGTIQPKKLFKDIEKSVPTSAKNPFKSGRVVPSRYNQNTNQANGISGTNDGRKRSLPENEKAELKQTDKRSESKVKKRWEIPSVEDKMVDLLPKIRTFRCVNVESPRDSGPAKRVSELMGRKSVFSSSDEDAEMSVCQSLDFSEEDDHE